MNLFRSKGEKRVIDRDIVTVNSGDTSTNVVIINTKRMNARLKFTNKSGRGDATVVNNGDFGLQYSEDGKNWNDFNITTNTVTTLSGNTCFGNKMPTPSGTQVYGAYWQWSSGEGWTFYTNEKHKWWRYFFAFRNKKYKSNYWVENYLEDTAGVPVVKTTITK